VAPAGLALLGSSLAALLGLRGEPPAEPDAADDGRAAA
jgi:hypothetical protein